MPNINIFRSVVHEKNITFFLCAISWNLYKTVQLGRGHYGPQGLYLPKFESPGPKDVPCQIPMYLRQWFMRRRLLKCFFFAIYTNRAAYIKMCPPGVGPFITAGTSFVQTWISWSQGYSIPTINAFRPVVHEKIIFKIPKISHIVASNCAPKGANHLLFIIMNLYSLKMLPTKYGWNQFTGFGEEVV